MSKQPNKLLTHGVPLVTLTLGGWLGIAYLMQGRIDVEVCHGEQNYLESAPVYLHLETIDLKLYSVISTASSPSFVFLLLLLQDAKRKEVDLRAPVHKQRAKRFNLDEELTKLKEAQQQNYTNKKIERPKEWWEQGKEKQ